MCQRFIFHIFDLTTKHEILQLSNRNLLCSLDPPNQGRLFLVVGPKLVNDNEYNWLHTSNFFLGDDRKVGDCQVICGRVRSEALM